MNYTVNPKFHQNHLENEDNVLNQSEESQSQSGKQMHSTVEFPNAQELDFQGISRNKRAVIERIIALWVLENKLKAYGNYGDRANHEFAERELPTETATPD
jgi:pyruvate-formate lyase